jgi:hypothetical protein
MGRWQCPQHANAQRTLNVRRLKIGLDPVASGKNVSRRCKKAPPCRGGCDCLSGPMQKLHSELFLKLGDGRGQRGLRHGGTHSSFGEAAGVGDRNEVPDLVQLQNKSYL